LWGSPEYPDFSKRGNPEHRVLAFGKWGTYKKLELMIEAFENVMERNPHAQLIVAGTDHPKAPGYLNTIAERYWKHPRIKFIGYVPEKEIPTLFQSTSVAVMPYTSSAGSSGIAHLASAYGVPIIASDIADCRQLVTEEGLAIEFYELGNHLQLADKLVALLEDPERLTEMALHNCSAALRMSMPEIIRQYVHAFDLQHQLNDLRLVSRARKVPRWMPLQSWLARRVAHKMARASVHSGSTVELPDPVLQPDPNQD
jgi:glycosyltransferase involved in cell wall biosynthesis